MDGANENPFVLSLFVVPLPKPKLNAGFGTLPVPAFVPNENPVAELDSFPDPDFNPDEEEVSVVPLFPKENPDVVELSSFFAK